MYTLTTEHSFDAAHFLAGYEGKCRNIHGHRWRVVAEVAAETLKTEPQQRGMLVDFGELKQALRQIVDEFDHVLVLERHSLKDKTLQALQEEKFKLVEVGFRPTAENFSEYFYGRLLKAGYPVKRVRVYETPNNCASYEKD